MDLMGAGDKFEEGGHVSGVSRMGSGANLFWALSFLIIVNHDY